MQLKIVLLLQICVFGASAQDIYRAAVVEYGVKGEGSKPEYKILENIQEYVHYIEQAASKNSSIIVFPEDGLTGNNLNTNIENLSSEIPNSDLLISPCYNTKSTYSKALIDLSCSAKTHKIYVVINLIEREYTNTTNTTNYYNTNVAFNKDGQVVAKYRKMHLLDKTVLKEGTSLSTFRTDFGVTFGMFNCFDILFKNPSLKVLDDKSVTDVICSTAWPSQLPFLSGLSNGHGYAKANGVNLLVSSLSNPAIGTGGSGIFLADGKILETYISSFKSSKMMIQDVPKILERKSYLCQNRNEIMDSPSVRISFGGQLPNISAFNVATEDMQNYTFKSLDFSKKIISESVCSGTSKFCCSFEIAVNTETTAAQNYVYKLVAFNGVRTVENMKTIGVQNCGIVACLNDANESCGKRHASAPHGIIFEKISMKGNFIDSESTNQPATLRFDMKPLTTYNYCKEVEGGKLIVNMTTTSSVDSLLTFGVFGRSYNNDNKPPGKKNTGSILITSNTYVVFLISVVVFLLQD